MQLLLANGGADLPAGDPAYLNGLLQRVLQAQIVDYDEREKPWKLTHRWWLQYLAGLIGVSIFGASITFGVLTTSSNASSVETSNHTSGTGNEPGNEPGTQDSNGTQSSPRFDEGTDYCCRTPLHLVAQDGDKAVMRLLVVKDTEMEDKARYGNGKTAV
ncbi:uncharacterized protein TRIVIDRAFT_218705 [Trichoderma virens Gv29-8]|uniref:Uncharacterized protein n=1 Tax=Hypocrea virens (strain Gv29-8 / FGSC 10586) TaxID=413071 RepID=G9MGA6_HYPVG|nr:uncharacterized protein TRIVIDRAFT_218705 [Trichoderma virens Gv29-8]EHK26555.1 hypothetical protein TRIVIDRAFT_218705 [Trichoderma virens Gv29-8]